MLRVATENRGAKLAKADAAASFEIRRVEAFWFPPRQELRQEKR